MSYIAIAGLHGCIPNYVAECATYDEAVGTLAQLHELESERETKLSDRGYLEMDIHTDGNEYCEIVKEED